MRRPARHGERKKSSGVEQLARADLSDRLQASSSNSRAMPGVKRPAVRSSAEARTSPTRGYPPSSLCRRCSRSERVTGVVVPSITACMHPHCKLAFVTRSSSKFELVRAMFVLVGSHVRRWHTCNRRKPGWIQSDTHAPQAGTESSRVGAMGSTI